MYINRYFTRVARTLLNILNIQNIGGYIDLTYLVKKLNYDNGKPYSDVVNEYLHPIYRAIVVAYRWANIHLYLYIPVSIITLIH